MRNRNRTTWLTLFNQIRSILHRTRRGRFDHSYTARARAKTIHLYHGHVSTGLDLRNGFVITDIARSIGCITMPKDFAVAGTAADKLFGIAESLWEPDLVSGSLCRGWRLELRDFRQA